MDPIIGGALVGAGSNIIANLFNRGSTNSANRTNLRIAQMNNEWSERMMQKQMDYNTAQWQREADYNTEMWHLTNEYNSAFNQAERLRKAGLNPALVMSGHNAGTASAASSPSGNSVGLPSPSSATMMPYKYDFSGIGSAVQSALQINNLNKVQDAQARYTNMQSDFYAAKTMAEIAKMESEARSHTSKVFYQNILNKYADSMLGQDYINKVRQNQSLEIQLHNTIKQGVLLDKEISRYDERTNAQVADLVASTALKYAQGRLSKEQLKKVISETKGIDLSNKEKDAIFDYVVKKAEIDQYKSSIMELPSVGAYAVGKGLKTFGKWLGF